MKLYPDDKPIPEKLTHELFTIRPLLPADYKLDFEAVMDSLDYYREFNPSEWSASNFDLSQNKKELENHLEDHLSKRSFTLTIASNDAEKILGCIYINHLSGLLTWLKQSKDMVSQVRDFEAQVYLWTRPSCIETNLDRMITKELEAWLQEKWAFESICFQTYEADVRQVANLVSIGLAQELSAPLPKGNGNIGIYRRLP
ncbi:MAG: hypothetical protein VYC39_04155 [Myxococcota bacterium]|nr:hypothetical protein [Myxococcota bacterium]